MYWSWSTVLFSLENCWVHTCWAMGDAALQQKNCLPFQCGLFAVIRHWDHLGAWLLEGVCAAAEVIAQLVQLQNRLLTLAGVFCMPSH